MNILTIAANEPFSPYVYGVVTKNPESGALEPIGDYTNYKWFCTVKKNLNDTDEESLSGVLDSESDPAKFDINESNLTIEALTQEQTHELDRDLTDEEIANGSCYNNGIVIETLYFDVWFQTLDDTNRNPIRSNVRVLKSVTGELG